MSKNIINKTFVVTGGADGIGYSIADQYLEKGAKVAILIDVNESRGKEAAELLNTKYGKGKAMFVNCDVTKDLEDTYNVIINNFKTIDVLVNSAGIADDKVPRRLIEINTTALIEWSLKFFKHMRKDRGGNGGTIVNISSLMGIYTVPFAHVYTASKFAINGFTRSLGHKKLYARSGVSVVSLCPGFTETNLSKGLLTKKGEDKFTSEYLAEVRNMNWQSASVVGKAALDILDEAESGSVWTIDGGKLREVIFQKFI